MENYIQLDFKETEWEVQEGWLDSAGSGNGQMTGSCGHGN